MSEAGSQSARVSRRIPAGAERVFRGWVEPALLERWLAPIAEADPRPGGRFRLVSKADARHVVTGEYREFVPPHRLVMTWIYEGPMAPAGKVEAQLTVEFRPDGDATGISLLHENLTSPAYLDAIRQGAWTKALDALEALLADPRCDQQTL